MRREMQAGDLRLILKLLGNSVYETPDIRMLL